MTTFWSTDEFDFFVAYKKELLDSVRSPLKTFFDILNCQSSGNKGVIGLDKL